MWHGYNLRGLPQRACVAEEANVIVGPVEPLLDEIHARLRGAPLRRRCIVAALPPTVRIGTADSARAALLTGTQRTQVLVGALRQ